jgi:hypothetical protein
MLILLTALAASLTYWIATPWLLTAAVLLTTALKGQQVVDHFMELADAPRFWRNLLLAYVRVLPLIFLMIYLW